MNEIRQSDIERFFAIIRNIAVLTERETPRVVTRRVNDFTDDATQAATSGDGTGSVGGHSDPTPAAALHRDNPTDYRRLVHDGLRYLPALEAAMRDVTRPTSAGYEERETTHIRESLIAKPGSGTCPACDHQATGDGDDIIVTQTGLCRRKCHRRWTRAQGSQKWVINGWHTVDDFVTSIRAEHGADLQAGEGS